MFLGLLDPDPDPPVRGMDPDPTLDPDLDPPITKQKKGRSMMKIAGSGSISTRHGSADPDPDPPQNVMDPQHC